MPAMRNLHNIINNNLKHQDNFEKEKKYRRRIRHVEEF